MDTASFPKSEWDKQEMLDVEKSVCCEDASDSFEVEEAEQSLSQTEEAAMD